MEATAEEEEDYMSAAFLVDAVPDQAPSARSCSQSRKRKQPPAPPPKPKPLKEIEKERRDEALAKPIESESKGFRMLKMLGYKEGTGLGANSQGITQPIGLEFHDAKSGLGMESHKRQRLEEYAAKQPKMSDGLVSSYQVS
eukprot:TRINITY_DN6178_c0_g1_i1.p1 TRINITY_DN6178_c0_g1~~TRINITY_DN6178_c0_g1_i1.p1  ORF type:complete len:141 (+),score=29.06 TRINITY_DN6178_c0_g1_i1:2-424(+)